nr:hypothetical protein Itr_chr02CG08240 [Ipomoea trifida]
MAVSGSRTKQTLTASQLASTILSNTEAEISKDVSKQNKRTDILEDRRRGEVGTGEGKNEKIKEKSDT